MSNFFTIFGRKNCNYIRKFRDCLGHSALEQRLSVFVDLASELWQNRIEMSFGMEVSFSQSYVVLDRDHILPQEGTIRYSK